MSGALPKLIAVVGTNASGKSSLAISLARSLGGEVISADSRQVYRGLDLGSGKVTAQEMQGVPHHLLDVCDPGTFFTMADFQRLAYRAIDDVLARGRVPVLAGGTGLYVDAVCDGYVLSNIEPDLSYRRELEKLSTPQLCAMQQAAAPGNAIDPQNRNRVMRALEKLHDGDTLPAQKRPRYDVLRLGVTWDRPTLCARIDERLARRVQQGMIEEIPVTAQVSAVSVGMVGEERILDLCYGEDSHARVDMNVVMTDQGEFIEVQGTGEECPFTRADLSALLELAEAGCRQLHQVQKEIIGEIA